MQEQMNKAMASLNEAVGDDVPTLNEVRDKIEARYAKAKAVAELNESTVDASIREIEEATANAAAQARLSELRSELGLEDTAGLAVRSHGRSRSRRGRAGEPTPDADAHPERPVAAHAGRRSPSRSGLGEHHQVVAVDGLVGDVRRQVARAAARGASQTRGVGRRHAPGEDDARHDR